MPAVRIYVQEACAGAQEEGRGARVEGDVLSKDQHEILNRRGWEGGCWRTVGGSRSHVAEPRLEYQPVRGAGGGAHALGEGRGRAVGPRLRYFKLWPGAARDGGAA